MTAINCIAGTIYSKKLPLKEKAQLYGMAGVFLVLLYNSPAGLTLYWTMNNVFSLLKNIYYAVKSKYKNIVIFSVVSGLCVFVIYYLMFIHKGNTNIRKMLAAVFGFVGVIPWVVPWIKKPFSRAFSVKYAPRDLFCIFICSCMAFWALAGLVVPSLLIASSPQEFSFIDSYTTPLYFLALTALQSFGLFVFWPLCLYLLFSAQVKKTGALLYLWMLLSAMCNVFLFPGDYGLLSVTLEFAQGVGHNFIEMLFNMLTVFLLAAAAFLIFFKKFKRLLVMVPALCFVAFLSIFVQSTFQIQKSYRELAGYYRPPEAGAQVLEPIFHLSKTGKNVVVIMLDRAINVFIPHIFEESPELEDIYAGFVYYPNTVSFNGYTAMGSPPIFGGYEYSPVEANKRSSITLKEKHNEALLMMPRIFSEAGYSITVADSPYANYEDKSDMKIFDSIPYVSGYITDSLYTNTWIKDHGLDLPSVSSILERNILWYGIFRVAPLFLREGLYLNGNWDAPISNRSLRLTLNGYSVLDYLPKLTDSRAEKENTATIMANNTTHETSFLQAPDYVPVTSVTNYGTSPFKKEMAYHINAAAIKRLADWFVFLKEEGLYNNSRIILVADHGAEPVFVTKTSLPFNFEQFNPLLMVKDFGAQGPLQTDMSFMSNADVPSIAFKDLIDDPVNPFTGNEITGEYKKNPLYIAISGSVHRGDSDARQYTLDPKRDYFVHDNIFDPANWERADR
jgi:hypothetical protein